MWAYSLHLTSTAAVLVCYIAPPQQSFPSLQVISPACFALMSCHYMKQLDHLLAICKYICCVAIQLP